MFEGEGFPKIFLIVAVGGQTVGEVIVELVGLSMKGRDEEVLNASLAEMRAVPDAAAVVNASLAAKRVVLDAEARPSRAG